MKESNVVLCTCSNLATKQKAGLAEVTSQVTLLSHMFMLSSQLTGSHKGLNTSRSLRFALEALTSSGVTDEPENSGVMLLLTLLFVSSVGATPLLGTEQCAHGPSYWCQNVKTASLCGAVTHCQQNVWNKPQMKSVPCDLCKEVVMVVIQILKDNATQAEVLGYLEKACQLIPDKGLSAECKELVDSYYPIIVSIIIGELENPGVACGAIGLCLSQQMALAEFHEQLMSNEIPQIDLSKSATPFLLNVPGLLYPQKTPKPETPVKGSNDVCQDCIKFMTDAQSEEKDNPSFVNSLIVKLEENCDKMGPGLSDMCKQYISMYGSDVLQRIFSSEQDPKDVCSIAGFCSAGKSSTPMLKLQAAEIRPASKMVPALKLVPATKVESAKLTKVTSQPMVRVRDSPSCVLCEVVMEQLENILKNQSTEEEVVAALEKVCYYLPSSMTNECKDLISTYGKAIFELLVQQADPKTVCTILALCNNARPAYIPALDKTTFKNGAYCKVCKMAVTYIDEILEKNATEAQIEEALRKVCNYLPASIQTECDQLVQEYEPMLVQMILQTLDPDFVCLQIGACPEPLRRLMGREQCTMGPSFWCKNMMTAIQCDAVAHCKRHMWA